MTALGTVLTSSKLRAARNAARGGEYQVLLGAGASVGAVNNFGSLPLAGDLVRILKARYQKAPIDEKDSLPRAYQRALHVSSEQDLWLGMREIFANANHQEWFVQLSGLPWRRVWTLNVDDAFENSYKKSRRSELLPLVSINWDEPYSETAALEVIHLHGHVIGRDPKRLVFSFNDYQTLAMERPVWDSVLAGVVAKSPIVVVGAKLLDDPDMERLLLSNRPASEAPSLVVDPFISDANAWELEKSGFVVLRVSAEEFVADWCDQFSLGDDSLRLLYEEESINLPQLISLETNRTAPVPRLHDYFGGDEPLWGDAVADLPALFGWIGRVIDGIEYWLDNDMPPEIHILYGERLTGVSSGLLLAARSVRSKHVKVLLFDKSSRFDTPLLVDLLRGRGPVVLLVDGAAEFADDLDRLLSEAQAAGDVKLYVLVSERPRNDLRLEGRLGGSYRKSGAKVPARLARDDASRIVRKLTQHGRLGSLEMLKPVAQEHHFKDRDIFSALLDVEYAIGFRKRVESELRSLDLEWKKELVFLLSLASQGGLRVGTTEIAFALERPADQIVQLTKIDDGAAALVEIVDDYAFARQRDRLLPAVIEILGRDAALAVLLEIVIKLSPLANRKALRERNRASSLVSYLVSCKQLVENFGPKGLDSFYESLRPIFGDWNGRYWEQRAIYAKGQGDWARAESFAARSVSLVDDPYSRTTLGTILINKAQNISMSGDSAWNAFYLRGKEQLEQARQREPDNKVTYFAYLQATIDLIVEILRSHPNENIHQDVNLRDAVSDWQAVYAALRVSVHDDDGLSARDRVEALSRRFMSVMERVQD